MSSRDNHRDSFKELVGALTKLPGVGPKTAQRYAFYFCKWIGVLLRTYQIQSLMP